MDKAAIGRIVEKRNELPLDIEGIQYYSGTQKKFEKIRKEAEMLKAFLSELKENYGFAAKRLEYGPGFGVGYFQSDAPVDETALLRDFCALFEDLPCGLVLEMGRFIAASCGEYTRRSSISNIRTVCDIASWTAVSIISIITGRRWR